MRTAVLVALAVLVLTGCQPQGPDGGAANPPADAPAPSTPLSPVPAIPAAFAVDLDARGNEPFWSIQIRPTQITLQRPDEPNLVVPNPGPVVDGARVNWTSQSGMTRITVSLALDPSCSDGMSEAVYPMAAEVTLGDQVLKGCAFPSANPPAPE